MANQKIFCNVPWTNLHIYWDGSFGACCSEHQPPHNNPKKYNIKNMSVTEWYNSQPICTIREQIKGSTPLALCQGCYNEE